MQITGGGGSGATAAATLDANGNLTGITVTNPGTGYTGTPTIALLGGGGSGATIGTTTLNGGNTSGGLTKTGSGTLNLTGANTYTGMTTVLGGVLGITGNQTNTSGITLGNATSLLFNSPLSLKTLTLGLAGSDAMGLLLSTGTATSISSTITVQNNNGFTANSNAGNVTLTVGDTGWVVGGTYPLINYTESIGGNGSSAFTLSPFSASRQPGEYRHFHRVQRHQRARRRAVHLCRQVNGNWDISTPNFTVTGSSAAFSKHDYPQRRGLQHTASSSAGGGAVVLTTTVTPSSVTVSNGELAYTFNGPGSISGAGGLTKTGSGSLTLPHGEHLLGLDDHQRGHLDAGQQHRRPGRFLATSGISDNASLVYNINGNQTAAYPISGSGSLTKLGGGRLNPRRHEQLAPHDDHQRRRHRHRQ